MDYRNKSVTEMLRGDRGNRRPPPMQDEGDMLAPPRTCTPWGLAWRIALAVATVYVLLTAALVLTRA